ncbi:MAG: PKD domain-containing protein [Bacteroidia bacterium]|nr:PKD domain-containing protein [Bacteroidia bacterium]
MNLYRILRLACFFALLYVSAKAYSQGSETDKLGYCVNPFVMYYQYDPSLGTPAPPYTVTWRINGNLVRTATATNSYSPWFPQATSWHDSLVPPVAGYTYNGLYKAGAYSYVVRMTNSSGFDRSYTWNVQYDSLIIKKTDAPATCGTPSTGSISITGFGATKLSDYTIVLNPGGTPLTGTSFNNLAPGTYTVKVDGKPGIGGGWIQNGVDRGMTCHDTYTFTIVQPAILSAVATASKNASCGLNNGEVSVTPSGGVPGYTYIWSPGGAVSQTVAGLSAGNYTVTVTDAMGCTNISSASITNAGAITATIGATNNVTCFGLSNGNTTVTAGNGTASYTYSWSNGSSNVLPTPTNSIGSLSAGTYTVTITDSNGCIASTNVTITEPSAINIPTPSGSPSVCGNNNGTASVTPTGGTPAYSYSWSNNSSAQTATGLAAATYTVTVTDANTCSQTATTTVAGTGSATINATSTDITCFGANNGSATVTAGGSPPYTYNWSSGQTTASVTGLSPGSYSVTITAGGCQADTVITIASPPDLVIVAAATTTPCGSSTGQVSVSPTGGTGAYTFLWSPGGAVSQTVSGLAAGTYSVTVTDNKGCSKSAPAIVSSIPGPSAAIAGKTDVTCKGTPDGTITVTASSGTSPYNYTWNTSPVQNTATASNLAGGTYSVTVSDVNGCTTVTSATITEPPLLTATNPTPQTVCMGQNTTLSITASGGTPSYTYSWLPDGLVGPTVNVSPTTSTTYTIIIADSKGCTVTKTVIVALNPPLIINASGTQTVCDSGSAPLSANASGGMGAPYTYSWMPGGLTGPNITVNPTATTEYTVSVTDGCGTPAATSVVTVTATPPPTIQFTSDITGGCSPLLVTFTNNTPNAAFCFWDFGDGYSSTACTDTHTYVSPGIYPVKLTVTDTNGCVNTLTIAGKITASSPIADFTMSSTSVSIYEPSINFTDKSTRAAGWLWDFGDTSSTSNSSLLTNPSHTYSDTGIYCIKLTVRDSGGCADSTVKCLTVKPQFTFYIPNAFSPNEDNINENFNGKGSGISKYKMMVFDRWGNLIFTTDDLNIGWDGKVQDKSGNLVQQDVYVYKIVLTDIFSTTHNYVGHVSVVR